MHANALRTTAFQSAAAFSARHPAVCPLLRTENHVWTKCAASWNVTLAPDLPTQPSAMPLAALRPAASNGQMAFGGYLLLAALRFRRKFHDGQRLRGSFVASIEVARNGLGHNADMQIAAHDARFWSAGYASPFACRPESVLGSCAGATKSVPDESPPPHGNCCRGIGDPNGWYWK